MPQPAKKPTHCKDGYPLSPIDVSETVWLYLEGDGVTVVHEERDYNGKHVATHQAVLPWSVLGDAVDLHRKLRKRGQSDE